MRLRGPAVGSSMYLGAVREQAIEYRWVPRTLSRHCYERTLEHHKKWALSSVTHKLQCLELGNCPRLRGEGSNTARGHDGHMGPRAGCSDCEERLTKVGDGGAQIMV